MRFLLILGMVVALSGCASVGAETPRQKTAVAVNLTLGAPFYVASYISGYALNVITYGTAWIWGEPEENEDIPLWFSSDFGPNYASMNTPWCWLYTGLEPGSRALLLDWIKGNHVSSKMGIRSLKHEWPPAFTFCRTEVGIRYNKRGDESFRVGEQGPSW